MIRVYDEARNVIETHEQLFIRTHNEKLSVAAMCVNNPNRWPISVDSGDTALAPTGFAETVCDDFPIGYPDFASTMNRRFQFNKPCQHFTLRSRDRAITRSRQR